MRHQFQIMVKLGKLARLDLGNLPTGLQLFSHYLHLQSEKVTSGEWKSNVSQLIVAREVATDLSVQWKKTKIPHSENKIALERQVLRLVQKCRLMTKTPLERRGAKCGQEIGQLFDIALFQHEDMGGCNCE